MFPHSANTVQIINLDIMFRPHKFSYKTSKYCFNKDVTDAFRVSDATDVHKIQASP